MELGMSDESDIEQESCIQKWAPQLVAGVFLVAIGFYTYQFHGSLSPLQSTWGEFGDFIGGLVNPIIGFFTIWLLAASLRQNHKALAQAKTELESTRKAIDDARTMQAATEAALTTQTGIAEHAKDMDNAIALVIYYRDIISNCQRIEAQYKQGGGNDSGRDIQDVRSDHGVALQRIDELLMIVDSERHRLVKKYINDR
jgi:hypothetical protein